MRAFIVALPALVGLNVAWGWQSLPKSSADRIKAVERSLIPYIPIAGYKPWTLQERMAFHRVAGATVAVIHNYQIDWIRSYGSADIANRQTVSNKTLFSVGSISKFANAMLIMKLVQDGKLRLDEPINSQLSGYKLPENEFTKQTAPTLRMLLTHTGGTSQSAFFGYQPNQKLPTTLETLNGVPPSENRPIIVNSLPGKEFRYSGGGVLLTQLAAAERTGKDYADAIEEVLFRPLKISSATMRQPLPSGYAKQAAYAYSDAAWFTGVPYVYPQSAAAGLYSNAEGIARMLIEVQNALRGSGSKVLSRQSAQEMVRPSAVVSEGMYLERTGPGTFLLELKSNQQGDAGRYFGHEGRNAGFLADALASVTGGNGVVILLNSDGQALAFQQEVRRAVAKVYGWTNFLPPSVTPVPVPATELDRLTGRFRKGNDEVATFRREGSMLMQNINGHAEVICVPQGKDRCFLTDFGFMAEFQLDEQGFAKSYRVVGISKPFPKLANDDLLPNELIRKGDFSAAVAKYRAMKMDLWALTSIAGDYIERKMFPAANALLELASELYPDASVVPRNQGISSERSGRTAEALVYFRKAVDLDKTDDFAVRRVAQLSGTGGTR